MTRVKIINDIFKQIEEYNISYAILHHIEKIYSNDDDIDFIVNCDKDMMLQFLINFTKENNCYLGKYYTIDRDIYRFDILYFEKDKLEKIELDCGCNGKGNDLLMINVNELLRKKIKIKIKDTFFYKVFDLDEIDYYIKKKAYKNSDVAQYINYFKILDINISKEYIDNKYFFWKRYFNSKSYKGKFYINKIFLLMKRLFERPSLTISFLGPDGSGKSTIIDIIVNNRMFINQYYFHLKPLKSKNENNTTVEDPHKYPPYSKLKSYIKLLYFIYQYNFGWLKNIMPLKIKSSLIIFDRYYDDMLVDTKRYRYGASVGVVKFARQFLPKPDIYFILTTDPKVIYERKQEVPFEELERQVKEYRALADGKRYFNIDVNRSPEDIAQEIMDIIMEKMNERY